MALRKILKRKPKKTVEETGIAKKTGEKRKKRGKTPELAPRVLLSPQITEKAFDLSEKNQYTFRIAPRANKTEVQRAIKELYGVEVLRIRVIKIPRKSKRLGKSLGWKKGYKKAVVRIKAGQKIEVMPR